MLQVFLISCNITHAVTYAHANTHTQTHTETCRNTQMCKHTGVPLHEVAHKLVKYCHLEMCACANAPLLGM